MVYGFGSVEIRLSGSCPLPRNSLRCYFKNVVLLHCYGWIYTSKKIIRRYSSMDILRKIYSKIPFNGQFSLWKAHWRIFLFYSKANSWICFYRVFAFTARLASLGKSKHVRMFASSFTTISNTSSPGSIQIYRGLHQLDLEGQFPYESA